MSRRPTPPSRPRPLYVTCDHGLEGVLADELTAAGATEVKAGHRGVTCLGDRRTMWRINLTSRVANRVLLPIAEFPARDRDQLYAGVKRINWPDWMEVRQTLAVDATSHESGMVHTGFVAQCVKDAVCDRFRLKGGRRPSVDRRSPDVRINVHLDRDHCTLSLDSSGERLHRRGYRTEAGEAPLRETLAAGILKLSGWDPRRPLVDPMCGAGTFLIEAALIARDIAPGLLRVGNIGFGFERWMDHDPVGFAAVTADVRARVRPKAPAPIVGGDVDLDVLRAAAENAQRAGVAADITVQVVELDALEPPRGPGTVVVNPPYGERLQPDDLPALYKRLGHTLKTRYTGWTAWVLVAEKTPAHIGLRADKKLTLRNGPIPCELRAYPLTPARDTAARPRR